MEIFTKTSLKDKGIVQHSPH